MDGINCPYFFIGGDIMDDKKEQVLKHIYDFFVTSADFNGIPLRQIGRELNISYKFFYPEQEYKAKQRV